MRIDWASVRNNLDFGIAWQIQNWHCRVKASRVVTSPYAWISLCPAARRDGATFINLMIRCNDQAVSVLGFRIEASTRRRKRARANTQDAHGCDLRQVDVNGPYGVALVLGQRPYESVTCLPTSTAQFIQISRYLRQVMSSQSAVLCQSTNCPQGHPPSKLECPTCNKYVSNNVLGCLHMTCSRLGIRGSFFCGQECFKANCEHPHHFRYHT